MAQQTAEQIAQRALNFGLLDERQLQEVWASLGSRNVALHDFTQTLVRREFLTNYQAERLVKGDRSGFFFGDYKVLYLVGTGTFARVFRAVHRTTGKIVALKVLRNRYSETPSQASQFVREGRLGCELRHPNIVPIYDVVSSGKSHFLVMEFIEGRNLREFVRIRKKLDAAEATRLMIGITDALRYAFEKSSLTHRDLKMSNILVSSRGEAKIVDFGLASMDETLGDDALCDTPNARTVDYAALERATGVRKDDTRSDIYFLGCIYYNMLTGLAPLSETRDRVVRLSKQRFLDVVPIQNASPETPAVVSSVVNKAMQLNVENRYQTPGAMVADLRIAERKLRDNPAGDPGISSSSMSLPQPLAGVPSIGRSVMVVESDMKIQDLFREGFKRAGYRVLVIADPIRAVSRFRQDPAVADYAIFNAQVLGQAALDGFNELGEDERTRAVPAVLLLDESQRRWRSHARTGPHRVTLNMPITMKQLRNALSQLSPTGDTADSNVF